MYPVSPGFDLAVLRVRPRSAWPYLMKALFDIRFDAHAQPALGPLPLQHVAACLQRLGVGPDRPPPRRLRTLQPGPRPLHSRLPLGTVLLTLLRTAIPQDPVTLRCPLRALYPVIDDVRPGL